MAIPSWLEPVRDGAERISADDLTRFVPPAGSTARKGAVLMLFGDGPNGPDLLLTERAHSMRSHPGQVSFPGGGVDPEDPDLLGCALREAEEETGLDPSGVEAFAQLPELWLPPSNFAVTPILAWWREESPVRVVDPGEVEQVLRVPIEELLEPAYRITVRHPSGYRGPGFLIGPEHDLILWGFTAGIIARLFDFVGWSKPWDQSATRQLPPHMLRVPGRGNGETRSGETRSGGLISETVNPAPNTNFKADL